jgi:uncharacterized protein with PIN domain
VAGLGVRLYTDEMIHGGLAAALRARGYDVLSCQEAARSNQAISDEEQLQFATQQGRAILTYNIGHFVRLDAQWKQAGRQHAGIVVTAEVADLGTLLRRVERHLETYEPADQHNTVLWLPAE